MKQIILTLSIVMTMSLQGFSQDNPFFKNWTTPYGVPPFEEFVAF